MTDDSNTGFDLDELRAQIERLDGDVWRVERTLKSTPYEETQLVYRRDTGAGPFVRKLFASDVERGGVYETLFGAQVAGVRMGHVPFLYECTRADGGLAVVMEYVRGQTLFDCVLRQGPSGSLAHSVAIDLCEALSELHTALDVPIIHRDVKPENVMLGEQGLKLVDFGIARTWREGAEHDTTRFGTPGYAPPEQFGFGQTSMTGDIYSAGMTIAFCCTAEVPTVALRESGFVDPHIPEWLRPVLVRATQLDPAERFQSALQMRDAVRDAARTPRGTAQASPARPAPRPSSADSGPVLVAKCVWNAGVVATYAFLLAVLAGAIADDPATLMRSLSNPITLVLAVVDGLLVLVMLTVGAYLCLFKVFLRRLKPLSRLTWRQELPVGIGIIVVSYLIIVFSNVVNGLFT